jgi:dTDP-4-amino-4,6-dideoxygalactose transaminase
MGRKSRHTVSVGLHSFYPAASGRLLECRRLVRRTTPGGAAARAHNHGQPATIGITWWASTAGWILWAAILKVKLRHFPEELERRQQVAAWYDEELAGLVSTPQVRKGNRSSWAQYTVRSPQRSRLLEQLKQRGVPTAIHYPMPLHQQEVYAT